MKEWVILRIGEREERIREEWFEEAEEEMFAKVAISCGILSNPTSSFSSFPSTIFSLGNPKIQDGKLETVVRIRPG